jgi:hypothetical protein
MHNYSRNMPPRPSRVTPVSILGTAALGNGLLYLLYRFPVPVLLSCAAFAVLGVIGTIPYRREVTRLAREREGESTCTFARSFDYRNLDTWILRAVYEELQRWCSAGRLTFPLRATDRLEDLSIDLEELWETVVPDIAYRTGRSLDNTKQNPLAGKVVTVHDLVMFFSYQPKKDPTAEEAVH